MCGGYIDVWMNCAQAGLWSPLLGEMATESRIRCIFDINVLVPIMLTKQLLSKLSKVGNGDGGGTIGDGIDIGFVSSLSSQMDAPSLTSFAATKAALSCFVRSVIRERLLGILPVPVNCSVM